MSTPATRRLTLVLFGAQSLGSAGFLAASTVSAIVGASLSGRASWAGVPSGVYQGGSALAAFFWGRAMDRYGRRPTLAFGLTVGLVGAALARRGVAAPLPFLCGLLFMGMANAALQLGRYVAAEIRAVERAQSHQARGDGRGRDPGAAAGRAQRGAGGAPGPVHFGPYAASAVPSRWPRLVALRLRPEPGICPRAGGPARAGGTRAAARGRAACSRSTGRRRVLAGGRADRDGDGRVITRCT